MVTHAGLCLFVLPLLPARGRSSPRCPRPRAPIRPVGGLPPGILPARPLVSPARRGARLFCPAPSVATLDPSDLSALQARGWHRLRCGGGSGGRLCSGRPLRGRPGRWTLRGDAVDRAGRPDLERGPASRDRCHAGGRSQRQDSSRRGGGRVWLRWAEGGAARRDDLGARAAGAHPSRGGDLAGSASAGGDLRWLRRRGASHRARGAQRVLEERRAGAHRGGLGVGGQLFSGG